MYTDTRYWKEYVCNTCTLYVWHQHRCMTKQSDPYVVLCLTGTTKTMCKITWLKFLLKLKLPKCIELVMCHSITDIWPYKPYILIYNSAYRCMLVWWYSSSYIMYNSAYRCMLVWWYSSSVMPLRANLFLLVPLKFHLTVSYWNDMNSVCTCKKYCDKDSMQIVLSIY